MAANGLAQTVVIEHLLADRPDQTVWVAQCLKKDWHAPAEQQRAMVGRLVVVAIKQHQVALGNQCLQRDLVRRRSPVEYEIGALRTEDLRCFLLSGALVPRGSAGHPAAALNCRDRHETPPDRGAPQRYGRS